MGRRAAGVGMTHVGHRVESIDLFARLGHRGSLRGRRRHDPLDHRVESIEARGCSRGWVIV